MNKKQIFITLTSLALTACNLDYDPTTAGSRPQASETMQIADDGHNLLWPVPQTAIDNDPNLLPQNPGY